MSELTSLSADLPLQEANSLARTLTPSAGKHPSGIPWRHDTRLYSVDSSHVQNGGTSRSLSQPRSSLDTILQPFSLEADSAQWPVAHVPASNRDDIMPPVCTSNLRPPDLGVMRALQGCNDDEAHSSCLPTRSAGAPPSSPEESADPCALSHAVTHNCRDLLNTERYSAVSEGRRSPEINTEGRPSREIIQLGGQFAHGTYKLVHHATWNSVPVAVLIMDSDALAHESAILEALERPHPNLVQFYGCCKMQGRDCLVMEVAEYGSLDILLRRCRAEGYMFTTTAKVSMGLQLCAGLAELASLGILHRDIASRNVLVHRMHPIHVKICDFGMAQSNRAVGGAETGAAAMQASALVPLRWLPPECLCGVPQWSTASDVWAFGVALWEIFADAEEPYSGMANDVEVGVFVRRGGRLQAPRDMCDDLLRDARLAPLGHAVLSDLYQIMCDCWHSVPEQRPSTNALKQRLLRISDSLHRSQLEVADGNDAMSLSPFSTTPQDQLVGMFDTYPPVSAFPSSMSSDLAPWPQPQSPYSSQSSPAYLIQAGSPYSPYHAQPPAPLHTNIAPPVVPPGPLAADVRSGTDRPHSMHGEVPSEEDEAAAFSVTVGLGLSGPWEQPTGAARKQLLPTISSVPSDTCLKLDGGDCLNVEDGRASPDMQQLTSEDSLPFPSIWQPLFHTPSKAVQGQPRDSADSSASPNLHRAQRRHTFVSRASDSAAQPFFTGRGRGGAPDAPSFVTNCQHPVHVPTSCEAEEPFACAPLGGGDWRGETAFSTAAAQLRAFSQQGGHDPGQQHRSIAAQPSGSCYKGHIPPLSAPEARNTCGHVLGTRSNSTQLRKISQDEVSLVPASGHNLHAPLPSSTSAHPSHSPYHASPFDNPPTPSHAGVLPVSSYHPPPTQPSQPGPPMRRCRSHDEVERERPLRERSMVDAICRVGSASSMPDGLLDSCRGGLHPLQPSVSHMSAAPGLDRTGVMLAFASVAHAAAQGNPEDAPINAFVRQWLSDIVRVRPDGGQTSSQMRPCSSQLHHQGGIVQPLPSKVTGSPTPPPSRYPALQPGTHASTSTSHGRGFLPPTPFDGSTPMPTSGSWYASSHGESLASQQRLRRPLGCLQLPRSAGVPMRPRWHHPPPPPRHGAHGCTSLPTSAIMPPQLRSPSPAPLWRKVESSIRRSTQLSSISGTSSCPSDAMSSASSDAGSSCRSSTQPLSEEDGLSQAAASAQGAFATPPAHDQAALVTTATAPLGTVARQLARLMQSGEKERLVEALRARGLELTELQGRSEGSLKSGKEVLEPSGRSSPTALYRPMQVLMGQAETAENRHSDMGAPQHEARPCTTRCIVDVLALPANSNRDAPVAQQSRARLHLQRAQPQARRHLRLPEADATTRRGRQCAALEMPELQPDDGSPNSLLPRLPFARDNVPSTLVPIEKHSLSGLLQPRRSPFSVGSYETSRTFQLVSPPHTARVPDRRERNRRHRHSSLRRRNADTSGELVRLSSAAAQTRATHRSLLLSDGAGASVSSKVSRRASLTFLSCACHSSSAAGQIESRPHSASMDCSASMHWQTPVPGHVSTGGHSSMSSRHLPGRHSDAVSIPSNGDSASGRSAQYSRFFGRCRSSGLARAPTPTAPLQAGLSRRSAVSAAGGSSGSTARGKVASWRSESVVSSVDSILSGGESTPSTKTAQKRWGGTPSFSALTIGTPSAQGGAAIAEDQRAAWSEEGAMSGEMGCVALFSARSRARTRPRSAAMRAVNGKQPQPHLLPLPSPASWARSLGTLMQRRRRSSVSRRSVDLAKEARR